MKHFPDKKRKSPKATPFALFVIASVALTVIALQPAEATEADSAKPLVMNPMVFFVLTLLGCTIIGILAPLSGVGGGVIFTPLFMGFTSIDSYIIRATGLLVAMAGALVAARPFLRKGIANMRLILTGAVPHALSAFTGALSASYIETALGAAGEAFIRGALGIIVIGIGCLFIFFGKRTEYPKVENSDSLTRKLDLPMRYWEASLGKVVDYKLTRASVGLILFCGVGLISGLFGLGAGWAAVPVFNMIMLAPLKVAATCSTTMISIGGTAAVWPYIRGGAMFPLFAVPSMTGLIVGALIGSRMMVRIKAGFVRWIVIVVMIGAGIRLISKAVTMM